MMFNSLVRLIELSEIGALVFLFCPVYENRLEIGQTSDPCCKVSSILSTY